MKGFLKMNIKELKEAIIKKRAAKEEDLKEITDLDFLREEFLAYKNGSYRAAFPHIKSTQDRWEALQNRRTAMQKVGALALEYMKKPLKAGLYFEKISHSFIKEDYQLFDIGFNEKGECVKKYFIPPRDWAKVIIEDIAEFTKKEFAI